MSGNEVALFPIQFLTQKSNSRCRHVTTGVTCTTTVATKFSNILILFKPAGVADYAQVISAVAPKFFRGYIPNPTIKKIVTSKLHKLLLVKKTYSL